jgi:HAD superfamily hydrolase (TIGR01490 family)
MNTQRSFAVFDIDGTLLRWQFFHAIVDALGESGAIEAAVHAEIREARMRWKTRQHPDAFAAYEKVLVKAYLHALENMQEQDHSLAIEHVFAEYKGQLFTYTRNLLNECKKQGKLLFFISGSHEGILRMMADELGVDDYIGANFEFKNGRYSGVSYTPVHDKAAALRQLVKKHDATFTGSLAIGDSESDIAVLELVEQPIAFNPTRGLYKKAMAEGWNIVVERKNLVYELEPQDGRYVLAQTNAG